MITLLQAVMRSLPGLGRRHASLIEDDGEDVTLSDECPLTDTATSEPLANRGHRRSVRRRRSSRHGIVTEGEDP